MKRLSALRVRAGDSMTSAPSSPTSRSAAGTRTTLLGTPSVLSGAQERSRFVLADNRTAVGQVVDRRGRSCRRAVGSSLPGFGPGWRALPARPPSTTLTPTITLVRRLLGKADCLATAHRSNGCSGARRYAMVGLTRRRTPDAEDARKRMGRLFTVSVRPGARQDDSGTDQPAPSAWGAAGVGGAWAGIIAAVRGRMPWTRRRSCASATGRSKELNSQTIGATTAAIRERRTSMCVFFGSYHAERVQVCASDAKSHWSRRAPVREEKNARWRSTRRRTDSGSERTEGSAARAFAHLRHAASTGAGVKGVGMTVREDERGRSWPQVAARASSSARGLSPW